MSGVCPVCFSMGVCSPSTTQAVWFLARRTNSAHKGYILSGVLVIIIKSSISFFTSWISRLAAFGFDNTVENFCLLFLNCDKFLLLHLRPVLIDNQFSGSQC
jgi:hypothetical protein